MLSSLSASSRLLFPVFDTRHVEYILLFLYMGEVNASLKDGIHDLLVIVNGLQSWVMEHVDGGSKMKPAVIKA